MEQPTWWFGRQMAGDKARESTTSEFFVSDSDNARFLIREGIQNSLDAGRDGVDKVRIRIALRRIGLDRENLWKSLYFDGLQEHVSAPRSGSRMPVGTCHILVFEDFGTIGLTGDPEEWERSDDDSNHFHSFFRAEGQSGKGESDLGRWGIGKQVFVEASSIRSIFGLTVRADDGKKLLMGMSVLRHHEVADVHHKPDGWMGHINESSSGPYVVPIEDESLIAPFESMFQLRRGNEPGLSLVIPYCPEDLSMDLLAEAILANYLWPIMLGKLEVEIQTPEKLLVLNEVSLDREIRRIGGRLRDENLPFVEMGKAHKQDTCKRYNIVAPQDFKWSDDLFDRETLDDLRRDFFDREVIAVRVSLDIEEESGTVRRTFYDVLIRNDGADVSGCPKYVREGIIVPKVRENRSTSLKGVNSVLLASDRAIGSFLGDSENPAHEKWEPNGTNFRGKYKRGRLVLDFVVKSPQKIVEIISSESGKEYRDLAQKYFAIELPSENNDAKRIQVKKGGRKSGPLPDIPKVPAAKPPALVVGTLKDGFVVSKGVATASLQGRIVVVRAAYDTRKGNPFKRYRVSDFDFVQSSPALSFEFSGVEILGRNQNSLKFRIQTENFSVRVSGFDKRRDLRIEVRTGLKMRED